jgi:hypothetical protein
VVSDLVVVLAEGREFDCSCNIFFSGFLVFGSLSLKKPVRLSV